MGSTNTKKTTTKKTKKKPAATRNYPRVSLEESLKIAQKIKEFNGGNSWESAEVAKAIGMAPRSTNFWYITASSRDFGFTIGTRDTKKIEIAPLGREIFYAPDASVERAKKIESFFGIAIFKSVFEHYKGSKLPDIKYLSNTLESEFKLDPRIHEEFVELFKANCSYLSLETVDDIDKEIDQSLNGTTSSTLVVGVPKSNGVNGKTAFVIMPFVERNENRPKGFFTEVLNNLLIPAGTEAGFTVETANKQGSDVIQSTIINDLLEADLVIADLTDHNPNVLFELGIRMAADKPVVIIKSSDTGRIFDVDNLLRVYEYSPNLWKSTVDSDLLKITDHINGAWENKSSEHTYMKILRRGTPSSEY